MTTYCDVLALNDVTAIISVCLAIMGGVFAVVQWLKTVNLKKAEYIDKLTETIKTDIDIRDCVYAFDYNIPWYDESFHGSGERERKIDRTLSYFSYICYLKRQRIINEDEFYFFRYAIKRTLSNPQLQDYFYNLYHFAQKNNSEMSFKYLFDYGEKEKLFDELMYDREAYNKNPQKFHKYLIF